MDETIIHDFESWPCLELLREHIVGRILNNPNFLVAVGVFVMQRA